MSLVILGVNIAGTEVVSFHSELLLKASQRLSTPSFNSLRYLYVYSF